MAITITAEPRERIPVELVGVTYSIVPPKSALAMKLAVQAKTAGDDSEKVFAAIDEWINKAFGAKDGDKIRARMDDEDDLLDINHVMALVEAVIELTAANPTTSSTG